jgi:hypothetical protein
MLSIRVTVTAGARFIRLDQIACWRTRALVAATGREHARGDRVAERVEGRPLDARLGARRLEDADVQVGRVISASRFGADEHERVRRPIRNERAQSVGQLERDREITTGVARLGASAAGFDADAGRVMRWHL